jgi:AcrR family transcriptional regulator
MARIVKKEQYTERRSEILATAQRLVYSKGFEQMTIQDILDDLQISKGAFYHYFGSKSALLEGLIESTLDQAEQILIPIAQDPNLPALEKLQCYFTTLSRWKAAQKTYLLALVNVWYADENAIVRQKMLAATIQRITPLITQAIRQGIQEGVLRTSYPDQAGEVTLSVLQSLGENLAGQLFAPGAKRGDLKRVKSTVAAYTDALERVLGASSGSLEIVDMDTLEEWVPSSEANPDQAGSGVDNYETN